MSRVSGRVAPVPVPGHIPGGPGHWEGKNPWGTRFFVITRRPVEQQPGRRLHLRGEPRRGGRPGQAAAGGKQVMGGANLIRQALVAELVDELTIIVAPVT